MAWAEKRERGYRGRYRDAKGNLQTVCDPATQRAVVFTHKSRAERAAAVAEEKARRSSFADPDAGRRSWGEWVEEWWPTRQVEPQTLLTDLGRRRKHLDPVWAAVPIGSIRRLDVERWVATMRRAGVGNGTMVHAVRLLSVSLTAAVDAEVIDRNPCARVKLPPGAQAVERFLSREEYEAVREQLPTTLDVLTADWLVHTGLRAGELGGLHWSRYSPERGQVQVVETYEEKVGTIKPYTKGRKKREVPLPEWLVRNTREILGEAGLPGTCGLVHRGSPCRSPLLIPSQRGAVLRMANWADRVWRPAVHHAGIGHCRVHDLRHTYASWLLAAGVPLARLSRLLGHESMVTTERYAHLAPGDDGLVRSALERPDSTR